MSEGTLTNFKPPRQGPRTAGRRKKIGRTTVKHNRLVFCFCLGVLLIFLSWGSIYFLWRVIGDSYGTGNNVNVMLSTRRQLCGHVPQSRHGLYSCTREHADGERMSHSFAINRPAVYRHHAGCCSFAINKKSKPRLPPRASSTVRAS
jgi:hypothetical protein